MEQLWYTAAAWVELALLASLISIRLGISIALMEIFQEFTAGNWQLTCTPIFPNTALDGDCRLAPLRCKPC